MGGWVFGGAFRVCLACTVWGLNLVARACRVDGLPCLDNEIES